MPVLHESFFLMLTENPSLQYRRGGLMEQTIFKKQY